MADRQRGLHQRRLCRIPNDGCRTARRITQAQAELARTRNVNSSRQADSMATARTVIRQPAMLDRVSARWLPRRLRYWLQVCRLPPRAAIFYVRAIRLARRLGDDWSLISATAPHHLSELIRLAKGRHSVVEIGTGSGWTTGVLALVDRQRTIRTFDPYDLGNRDRYLALLGSRRLQITVNKRRGRRARRPASRLSLYRFVARRAGDNRRVHGLASDPVAGRGRRVPRLRVAGS